MSADNWTPCPRCRLRWTLQMEETYRQVEAQYGSVSSERYRALAEGAATQAACMPAFDTFREDYEIGVTDGVFVVSYHGHCAICSLTFTFAHPPHTLDL